MRIGFVAEDFLLDNGILRPSGCSYYRCLLPMNTLKGLRTAFGPPAFTAEHGYGVRTAKDKAEFGFDVIVMKMLMSRWVPKQIKQAQELGQIVVVDVDDYYPGIHDSNRAYAVTDPEKNKISNRDHYHSVIMAADWVTVSTPFLRDYYLQFRDNVVMVRNGINPDQFTKRDVRNRKPVLGWAGSIAWRSNDVQTTVPWLGEFLEEHDLMFHHAGDMPDAPKFAELSGIDPDRIITSLMKPLHRYHEMLDFDIGVVLLSEIDFNRAKSTIKGLEYAASNIPFVAQGLPEYELLSQQGVGRVAYTAEGWKAQLTDLLDYKTRKREAATQRNLVIKDHSIQARAHEWVEFYSKFTEHRAPIRNAIADYVFVGG
jgi:hypothetical protein